MKKTLLTTAIILLSSITVMAQKQVYMPDEWKNNIESATGRKSGSVLIVNGTKRIR